MTITSPLETSSDFKSALDGLWRERGRGGGGGGGRVEGEELLHGAVPVYDHASTGDVGGKVS